MSHPTGPSRSQPGPPRRGGADRAYRALRVLGGAVALVVLIAVLLEPGAVRAGDVGGLLLLAVVAIEGLRAMRSRVPSLDTRYPASAALLGPWAVERRSPEWALAVAAYGREPARVAALLASGAAADRPLPGGVVATPLHWAAIGGREACIRPIASAMRDIDAADEFGWTPLHWTAAWGDVGAAQCLLALGSAPDAKTGRGETAAILARRRRHRGLQDALARCPAGRKAG